MPSVRIVVPTYNRSSCLREAIQSILNQDFSDYEVVVSDDGSTDGTEKEMIQIIEREKKIKYIKSGHRGVAATRNQAINLEGNYDYVAFLDSDDIWTQTHLKDMVAIFEDFPEVDFIFSGIDTIDYSGHWSEAALERRARRLRRAKEIGTKVSKNKKVFFIESDFFLSCLIKNEIAPIPSAVMLRATSVKRKPWFDESLMVMEDCEFYLFLADSGLKFCFVDETLVHLRYFGDNLTGSQNLKSKHFIDKNKSLNKYSRKKLDYCRNKKEYLFIRMEMASQNYLLAQAYVEQSKILMGLVYYCRSFFLSPSSKILRGVFSSILPSKFKNYLKKLKS